ncbi:hypothetical protein RIF23_09845 [Lipingzhangella sp. LS1_29]|uniref:Uncharacterized protein n=1 Tax=Lipingzhangella rawalii TaxID=2055835 RepID=A0ABU2H5L3_9ACTN|nr:hypothetical protein [Lipingzhangella rawalii]MDS1270599.1 hypothetical protein [Lipingzhangella rawalii]
MTDHAPPERTAGAGRTRRHRRRRRIWTGAVLLVSVLVAAGLGGTLYWERNLRPVTTEYEYHEGEQFLVRHPAGWELATRDSGQDRTGVEIEQRQDTDALAMAVLPWAEHEDGPDASMQLAGFAEDMSTANVYADYSYTELDPERFREWPSHWDVAAIEASVTYTDAYLDRHLDVEESDWFEIWLQVHVDNRVSYTLTWAGPQPERIRYDEVIHGTMGSFQHDP